MGISKTIIASFLLSLIVLQLVQAIDTIQVTSNSITEEKIDCGGLCAVRCSKTRRPNSCKRACGTCCFRCNCVPPGTSGNYEACPCYASLTTHGGVKKCP